MQKRRLTSPAWTGLILSIFALTVGSIVGAIALTAMYTGHTAAPMPVGLSSAPAPVSDDNDATSTPTPGTSLTPSAARATTRAARDAGAPTTSPASTGPPIPDQSPSPSGRPTASRSPTPRPSRTCRGGDHAGKSGSAVLENCND